MLLENPRISETTAVKISQRLWKFPRLAESSGFLPYEEKDKSGPKRPLALWQFWYERTCNIKREKKKNHPFAHKTPSLITDLYQGLSKNSWKPRGSFEK